MEQGGRGADRKVEEPDPYQKERNETQSSLLTLVCMLWYKYTHTHYNNYNNNNSNIEKKSNTQCYTGTQARMKPTALYTDFRR